MFPLVFVFGAVAASNTSKPHIITLVVDDLGFHDTQIHNPASFMTPHFGELSKQGITLMRHHTYKFCSPTVRVRVVRGFVNINANDRIYKCMSAILNISYVLVDIFVQTYTMDLCSRTASVDPQRALPGAYHRRPSPRVQ